MDTHVDHQDRTTALLGEPTLPDVLLCHTQAAAVDFLERCVRDLVPLTALTGDAGTGKTTALNAALARRDSAGDRIIRAHNFVAGPLSLHRALTTALGVPDARELSADRLEPSLRRALAEAGHATPPVLAVDNAQSLLPETLRYLSLLAGLREAGRPLLRILLVGRSGFTARQPMPVQFTLEPIQPHAALQVVEWRLAAAGVSLENDAVQGIVHDARGNLRRLNTLLRARIEEAQASGRRRLRLAGSRVALRLRRLVQAGLPRWRHTLAAASALLALSAACGFIAYQSGAPAAAGGHAAAAIAPVTPPQARPVLPAAAIQIRSVPRSAVAEPLPAEPLRAAPAPTQPAPVVPASASPVPAAAPPAASEPPALPTASATQAGRFRVNNISSCHRGICPKWSVTDLSRQTHFIAAFDPSSLHLDHDAMQRLRQGTLELTVTGSVKKHGPDGQTLIAETLQSTSPHHAKPRQSTIDATDAPPQEDRSPPPGFLVAPLGSSAPTANSQPDQNVGPEQ